MLHDEIYYTRKVEKCAAIPPTRRYGVETGDDLTSPPIVMSLHTHGDLDSAKTEGV
jgi:hypothetical protein